jgi:hypothetical protein
MVGFDDLPHPARSLLLATLNLEIVSARLREHFRPCAQAQSERQ